jgi:hypothetical protein
MRKSTNPLTPDQVYRYAVACCQPHLKLRDVKLVFDSCGSTFDVSPLAMDGGSLQSDIPSATPLQDRP